MLEEYETKIVIYIRRQDEWLISWYGQRARSFANNTDHISEFILEWKEIVDYYSRLKLWKDLFGINNIIVRPFEKEQMNKGSLIDDFLAVIDLGNNANDFKLSSRNNISYNKKAVKLMILFDKVIRIKQLSQLTNKLTNKHWWEVAYFRQYISYRLKLAELISRFIPDFLIHPELLSKEDRETIMEEFAESNRKVAKEYLGREDGILFYSNQ